MSTIILPYIVAISGPMGLSKRKSEAKQVIKTPLESSRDYRTIIGITSLLFGIVLVSMAVGTVAMSYYASTSGPSIDQISDCRQLIVGFEQRGFYVSQEQFKSALSYCYN